MRTLLVLMTTLSIAGCASFAPGSDFFASGRKSEEARAVCDAWRATIVATVRDDRRELREQELLARETHLAVCR